MHRSQDRLLTCLALVLLTTGCGSTGHTARAYDAQDYDAQFDSIITASASSIILADQTVSGRHESHRMRRLLVASRLNMTDFVAALHAGLLVPIVQNHHTPCDARSPASTHEHRHCGYARGLLAVDGSPR
jgi:hypothetical protein